MNIETFSVPKLGIGRRDYSKCIEYAAQASFRGHQVRISWSADYIDVDTLPYSDRYGARLLFFDAEGKVTTCAPATPYHIYELIGSTERNALLLAGLYRFASEDDVNIFNVEKWYGDIHGYGKVEMRYTAGIKTVPGRIYYVGFAEYSEQPTFSIRLIINALMEEIRYG